MSHDFKFDPLHAAVPQGGFSKEKGGNLRDHNGCVQGPGTASTTHYDGDYGVVGPGAGAAPMPTGAPIISAPGMPLRAEAIGMGKGPRR